MHPRTHHLTLPLTHPRTHSLIPIPPLTGRTNETDNEKNAGKRSDGSWKTVEGSMRLRTRPPPVPPAKTATTITTRPGSRLMRIKKRLRGDKIRWLGMRWIARRHYVLLGQVTWTVFVAVFVTVTVYGCDLDLGRDCDCDRDCVCVFDYLLCPYPYLTRIITSINPLYGMITVFTNG